MQQSTGARPGWRVLLIGGNSGTGKTQIGKALASYFSRSLLLVDDIRMAIQQVTTPAEQPGIHYFLAHPTIWQKPPEALCDGFIAVGNGLVRPLTAIIAHHSALDDVGPLILAGDDILPALAAQRTFANKEATLVANNSGLRSVFLIESDEEIILRNMRLRGRGFESFSPREQETQVRASRLYGQWLRRQADHYDLPVVESRPWETLLERVVQAAHLSE